MILTLRQNLALYVLVLIRVNVRPLPTSTSPLLPSIHAASRTSYALIVFLTALPVITMGVLALGSDWVDRTASRNRGIALNLLAVMADALLRESTPYNDLLLSSIPAEGIGIGIVQATIPAVIERLFARRTPLVMRLWSAALMGDDELDAAFTPWLVSHNMIWYQALAWWAFPALLTPFSWLTVYRQLLRTSHQTGASPRVAIIGQRRVWTLGLYLGLIDASYASLIAWLPPYYIQLDNNAQYDNSLLALLTVGRTAGALLLPALACQGDRHQLLLFILTLQLIGFCDFIWLPQYIPTLWVIACGMDLGGAFPLCLVLALSHAEQPTVTGRLVMFMQSVGFTITGLPSWLSDLLRNLGENCMPDWS